MPFKYKANYRPDAYDKYADSYFQIGCAGTDEDKLLKHVHPADRLEMRVAIALAAATEEYVDNYRIFPVYMTRDYHKVRKSGCCGSFDCSYRCNSGRVYLYGFNHGH